MPARPGGFRPRSSVDVVPDRRLESEPIPSSRDDIDALFQELAYLDSLEATANAICETAVRAAQASCAKKLVTEVDGPDGQPLQLTFADRRKALVAAALAYAELHDVELFEDAKTAEFNFGAIKKRKQPDGIAILPELTVKEVKQRLDKRAKVASAFGPWLRRKLFGVALSVLLRFKSEVNVEGIKKAFLAGDLSLRSLKALGFKPSGGEETLSVDVKTWTVRSEPRNVPDVAA